ncbi:hypothetical protein AAEX28_02965 [Lentisphaerota bacterium WC36G]|nr:hypothetical protein LJT99_05845 [Lentisphaerae bacterium WC36]
MRAKKITDFLTKNDRVAVSNITGREACSVSINSQRYGQNIIGGWALGKGGNFIKVPGKKSIPVFSDYGDLLNKLPEEIQPNKIVIYSPPNAVYGEVKNIIRHTKSNTNNGLQNKVETIYIITENVSVEVSAKIYHLAQDNNIDVVGCNTLGIISPHDKVRIGAIGGDSPWSSILPGSATIISNSGNMVNTIASYLKGAGIGVRYGISTGKDKLILTSIKDYLKLALNDRKTKLIMLYVEPGGLYELDAVNYLKSIKTSKPIIVYIGGSFTQKMGNVKLGHAGAVVEGFGTSFSDKVEIFDNYFNVPPFKRRYHRNIKVTRGFRIEVLHDLPMAARFIFDSKNLKRDFNEYRPPRLNPWLKNFGELGKLIPPKIQLPEGHAPEPYAKQLRKVNADKFGKMALRRNMKNASHVAALDGKNLRIYGRRVSNQMQHGSFISTMFLTWTGFTPKYDFEVKLLESVMIGLLTNGANGLTAQAAKLTASAGGTPLNAMISSLSCMGNDYSSSSYRAIKFLIDKFHELDSYEIDVYDSNNSKIISNLAQKAAREFGLYKVNAEDNLDSYEKVPGIGHPLFKDATRNVDPRCQVIFDYLFNNNIYHGFINFYQQLVEFLFLERITPNQLAINIDGVAAAICAGIFWERLCEKKITKKRVYNIPLLMFAFARVLGGTGEYLDHFDYGTPLDMVEDAQHIKQLTIFDNED